jgi:hypothetical protein
VGTVSEEISLDEAAGCPALRRTQVLVSDELGGREAETIVFRSDFLPYSHLGVTSAYRISVAYHGNTVSGERRLVGGEIIPIKAEFESPVFDSHSIEVVIRLLPLAADYAATIPVFHAARGKQMMVTVRVLARETVRTSDGLADAWRVQTDWDGVTQCYWVDAEARRLIKQSSRLSESVQLQFVG